MKLLAFTDIHANLGCLKQIENKIRLEKPDLVICCGDFSIFGSGADFVAKKLNSFDIKVLMIPGNHESPSDIIKISKKYHNLINLHKIFFEHSGYTFFGFGTGGFSLIEHELENIIIKNKKDFLLAKKLIFVTHAPIYRTKLDFLSGAHRGCRSSRKFVEKFNPVLTLCGHFHENEKKKDIIKDCLVINPGKFGMILEI